MLRPKTIMQKRKGTDDMSQFEIFAVHNVTGSDDEFDSGDEALEAELMNIISSDKPKGSATKRSRNVTSQLKNVNLDKMVADSLQDVPSDASLSGDEDDPSLLAELRQYTGEPLESVTDKKSSPIEDSQKQYIAVITERINMYKEAEMNANSVGDISKARRMGRGLKTLNELLKQVEAGRKIDEEDVPLPIPVIAKKPPEIFKPVGIDFEEPDPETSPKATLLITSPQPSAAEVENDEMNFVFVNVEDEKKKELLDVLNSRKDQYKKAAVVAKRNGNIETALAHVKIIKQFDVVINAVEEGQQIDLSTMPPPPSEIENLTIPPENIVHSKNVTNEDQNTTKSTPTEPEVNVQSTSEEKTPEAPATILEALEQRLNRFREQEEAGKKDGNMSKARRMGRIVKQYEDAIKLHNNGKPIPIDELPTPPGFPPIPVESPTQKPSTSDNAATSQSNTIEPKTPTIQVQPGISRQAPNKPNEAPEVPPRRGMISPPSPQPPSRRHSKTTDDNISSSSKLDTTRQERQLLILKTKQKEFKEAALKSKKSGDIAQAKEYLRLSKCFDPLIEATISGFPVDMTTLPTHPNQKEQLEKEYARIGVSDGINVVNNLSQVYQQLLTELQDQLQICMDTRSHLKELGEIASANRYEQLAIATKQDIDTLRIASNKGDLVPKFHYEKRYLMSLKCNVDLTDNELEVNIIQGTNYNVPNPKEIDTYVKLEFPFPSDNPYRNKTHCVYNTNSPVYDSLFKIDFPRTSRSFQRMLKRFCMKFEIWSKGGFFRSDSLVATLKVKLQPFETDNLIHDCYEIMDGRRPLGGKLEIKLRIRNPVILSQTENLERTWLVIDQND